MYIILTSTESSDDSILQLWVILGAWTSSVLQCFCTEHSVWENERLRPQVNNWRRQASVLRWLH